MTTSTEPTRILSVSENPQILASIRSALEGQPDLVMVESEKLEEGILQAVFDVKPDIVLLDFQYHPGEVYGIIDQLTEKVPDIAVIMILPQEEIQHSNRLILAGARTFVSYPFPAEELSSTVRRVRELQLRSLAAKPLAPEAPKPTGPKSQMFVIFSPKGGAGCTTVSVNLTIALNQLLHQEILLVDGKHLLGHVALMLNLRGGNSISDLLIYAGKLDASLIRQVVVRHVSGINILPSPISITKAQGIRPDDLYKVILGLQNVYPYIIVDGGNHLDDNLVTYMDAAQYILLVVNPNLACLRDARQFLDIAQSLSYPREKILILLNLTGHKTDVKLSEIEQVLQTKVFGMIPADEDAVLSSLNEGVPIILKKPGHPVSKAYTKVAKALVDSVLAKAPARMEEPLTTPADALKKSSRLG